MIFHLECVDLSGDYEKDCNALHSPRILQYSRFFGLRNGTLIVNLLWYERAPRKLLRGISVLKSLSDESAAWRSSRGDMGSFLLFLFLFQLPRQSTKDSLRSIW